MRKQDTTTTTEATTKPGSTTSCAAPTGGGSLGPLGRKLALAAAGTGALVALPGAAHAAVVAAHGIPSGTPGANFPISPPPATGSNVWDVDGDTTGDFTLDNSTFILFYPTTITYVFAELDDANGGRLVVPAAAFTDGIAKLPYGEAIGTSLAAAYKFHASTQSANTITSSGLIGGDASAGGWVVGDTGYFGFKFTNAGGTHFGWGELEIFGDAATPGDGYRILQAWYNDTPDARVLAGVVPEPSSASLLALGAAGLFIWRRRRA